MLRLYVAGLIVLLAAIVLNVVVARTGVLGWYDFLLQIQRVGLREGIQVRTIDAVWLFVGYPFLLGLAAAGALKLGDLVP
jgi:hypothetical protein